MTSMHFRRHFVSQTFSLFVSLCFVVRLGGCAFVLEFLDGYISHGSFNVLGFYFPFFFFLRYQSTNGRTNALADY